MTVEFILITGGLLLIAAALFGGGFKIKEVEVPQLRGLFRVIAGCLGAIVLTIGIWIKFYPPLPNVVDGPEPPPDIGQTYGKLIIGAYLSDDAIEGQANESWKLYIDGDYWGVLNVNSRFSDDELVIEITEGQHSWYLEGTSHWVENQTEREVDCSGQGQIDVRNEDKYWIEVNLPWPPPENSGQCIVTLFRDES